MQTTPGTSFQYNLQVKILQTISPKIIQKTKLSSLLQRLVLIVAEALVIRFILYTAMFTLTVVGSSLVNWTFTDPTFLKCCIRCESATKKNI